MTVAILGFDITHDETLTTERKHNTAKKNAYRKVAQHHARVRIGKHFQIIPETEPGGAYGYERRSGGYIFRKERLFGHRRPNEFNGKTKRRIGNTSKVTATKKGSKFQAKGAFPLTAQRRAELEAISPGERNEIGLQLEEFYFDEVRPLGRRRRRRRIRR